MAKKKTKRKTTPLRDRFQRQVGDEATLRFNPERSTLRGALQDAAEQLTQEVTTARGTSRGVQEVARASQPQFRQIYGEGQQAVSRGQQDLAEVAGPSIVGPGASRDAIGTQRRLSESMAAALAETVARQSEAKAGEAFAINKAEDRYGTNVNRVQTRLGDLSREEGAFVSGRLGELLGEDRKLRHDTNEAAKDRSQSNTNSIRSSGIDPATGKPIPGGKLDPKKKKDGPQTLPGGTRARTPGEQTTFRDSVSKAMRTVKPFVGKITRAQARALFLQGADRPASVDEARYQAYLKQGKSIGEAKRLATKPARKVAAIPETQLRVVLDMLYDGHISPETKRKLWQAGIIVKPLGTTDRKAARPRGVKVPETPAQRRQGGRRAAAQLPVVGRG